MIRTLDRIITVGFVIVETVVVMPFTRGEWERFGIHHRIPKYLLNHLFENIFDLSIYFICLFICLCIISIYSCVILSGGNIDCVILVKR